MYKVDCIVYLVVLSVLGFICGFVWFIAWIGAVLLVEWLLLAFSLLWLLFWWFGMVVCCWVFRLVDFSVGLMFDCL